MDMIKEINDKYLTLEAEVDRKLENIKRDEERLEKDNRNKPKSPTNQANKILSYEEAIARNTNLLKSLEIAKARLRSRSTFSPLEKLLKDAIQNYKRDLESSKATAPVEPEQDRTPGPTHGYAHAIDNIYDEVRPPK